MAHFFKKKKKHLTVNFRTDYQNTQLLRKGKYHYTADILFDWFGFNQTSKYGTTSA